MAGKRGKDFIGLDQNVRSEILLTSASLPLDQIGDKLWDVRTGEIGFQRLGVIMVLWIQTKLGHNDQRQAFFLSNDKQNGPWLVKGNAPKKRFKFGLDIQTISGPIFALVKRGAPDRIGRPRRTEVRLFRQYPLSRIWTAHSFGIARSPCLRSL